MASPKPYFSSALLIAAFALSACGAQPEAVSGAADDRFDPRFQGREAQERNNTTIWEAFAISRAQENIVSVNKYLWSASLEVLNFLPVESVDPFTGVIITDYGTPPGGSRSYRATILIDDPALNARALNVSLQTRNGPADQATVRAVEDAILTRARQLRIADNNL
ncbi:MAG: DUF3576 domain-containing protein [Pseudomonadota bacterium]